MAPKLILFEFCSDPLPFSIAFGNANAKTLPHARPMRQSRLCRAWVSFPFPVPRFPSLDHRHHSSACMRLSDIIAMILLFFLPCAWRVDRYDAHHLLSGALASRKLYSNLTNNFLPGLAAA